MQLNLNGSMLETLNIETMNIMSESKMVISILLFQINLLPFLDLLQVKEMLRE